MMEHIIYKTTNSLNSRFYIGMHSTTNIDDGYLGSGRRIKAEIKKYGKENFTREILEHLPSREALCEREAEIVCEKLMQDPLCLNLKNGGEGGGRKWSDEHQRIRSSAGGKKGVYGMNRTIAEKRKNDEAFRLRYANAKSAAAKGNTAFLGKTHTEETKQLMRKPKNQGEKNSQFGTCWVTNGVKPVKIMKEQLDEYLAKGFIRGRK